MCSVKRNHFIPSLLTHPGDTSATETTEAVQTVCPRAHMHALLPRITGQQPGGLVCPAAAAAAVAVAAVAVAAGTLVHR